VEDNKEGEEEINLEEVTCSVVEIHLEAGEIHLEAVKTCLEVVVGTCSEEGGTHLEECLEAGIHGKGIIISEFGNFVAVFEFWQFRTFWK
jgi:hypothetical protein